MRQRIAISIGTVGVGLLLIAAVSPLVDGRAETPPMARGAELFATKGCAHCHGNAGVGGNIGPDLQLVRKRMTAAEMTKRIHDGGQAMPAFGDQLTEVEIQDLVVYLRAKRKLIVVPRTP